MIQATNRHILTGFRNSIYCGTMEIKASLWLSIRIAYTQIVSQHYDYIEYFRYWQEIKGFDKYGLCKVVSIYHNLTPPFDNQAVHNIPSNRSTATDSGFIELSRLSINPDPSITSSPIRVQ